MPSLPRVTIVTPSFNQGAFLEQTILSVLSQDYAELEYIVIDGGSTDGSIATIQKHEAQLAFWTSETDRGQVDAINKGFARATGEILAWLNSDDLLAPSAVRIAVHYLGLHRQTGLVYGDRLHIDLRGNVIGVSPGPAYYDAMLRRNITIPQETAFFRRSAFAQAGGLDIDLHFAMDFDLWCRMARVTVFKHMPAFLGYYREHSLSKSTIIADSQQKQSHQFRAEQESVYRKHFRRPPPSRLALATYRLLHKTRFAFEQTRRPYQEEREQLRRLAASPLNHLSP